MRWVSRLTTAAVVVILVGALAWFIHSRMPRAEIGGGFEAWAMFRDGSRLAVGSPVVIAGVRIGDISRVGVAGRFARVDVRLRDDLEIPADSFVTRRADSLFGDSYLEIIITSSGDGSQPVRLLASGDQIVNVVEGGSTDTVLRAMERSMPRIDNALELVYEVMTNGRKFIAGEGLEGVERADRWLEAGRIEGPLSTARDALVRLEDVTAGGASAIAGARPDVARTLGRVDRAVAEARSRIADVKESVITGMRDTREGLDRVDEPIRQAAEVMAAIHDGEGEDFKGTLGRLINDPELGDTLEDATSAGREAVAGFFRFKSWLGARLEFNAYSGVTRFYASAEIRGRTDKFYLIELERGPLGGLPTDQLSDVASTNAYVRTQEIRDALRFTAQFGKQIGRFSIRGGIKDSTFGIGTDLLMLEGRLKISADLFGSFQRTPRLKLAGALAVFRSIYVIAGVDDALNDPQYLNVRVGNTDVPDWLGEVRSGRDYFIGGALHFDDADLATLLRVYGALLASAIAF